MSGGHYDYIQFRIGQLADDIEGDILKQGKESEWCTGDDKYYNDFYPDEINKIMLETLFKVKEAEVYVQRLDWYLSGDDGDDNYLKRLKKDLELLEQKKAEIKERVEEYLEKIKNESK